MTDKWRPDGPLANSFEVAFCDDPNCGLHIKPMDRNNKPMCEVVMSAEQTRALVELCKEHLYEKVTKRI